MLKRVVIIFLLLVSLLSAVTFLLPKEFSAQRSMVIEAPANVVFHHVNTLPKNEAWSPWKVKDPTVKITYSGTSSAGVGATYSWTSAESDKGSLTIIESTPYTKIVNSIDFGTQGKATGTWLFEAQGDKTNVTWRIEGEAQEPLGRWFGLMMDRMVGPDFELGLGRLKAVVEKA